MSLLRHNPRRDANEAAIVAALEAAGCHVERLSGFGVPDLLISRRGRWHVAEVKTPRGRLKKSQQRFAELARAPVAILRSVQEALDWARGIP